MILESGEFLIGVNILVKGISMGIVIDIDGSYNLDVLDDVNMLVFFYIGYNIVEVKINKWIVI